MPKLTLSIQPTFLDARSDIYHKAGSSIEFDTNEMTKERAYEILLENYFELVRLERKAVKKIRKNAKFDVKKFIADVTAKKKN